MGTKGSASPYPEVFDLDGVSIYENFSETLKTHADHTSEYTPADIQEHVEYYKSVFFWFFGFFWLWSQAYNSFMCHVAGFYKHYKSG
jgi:hypothetical protein